MAAELISIFLCACGSSDLPVPGAEKAGQDLLCLDEGAAALPPMATHPLLPPEDWCLQIGIGLHSAVVVLVK